MFKFTHVSQFLEYLVCFFVQLATVFRQCNGNLRKELETQPYKDFSLAVV